MRSSSGTDHNGTGTVTINASNPKQVRVTLDSAVNRGETLTVNYTKPGASPLKDTGTGTGALAALEVATFSGKTVKNETPPPALVSNTGQTTVAGTLEVGGSSNWANAITFTTGSNTAGYTLSSVDVTLAAGTPSTNTRVSIYSTSGSRPSTQLQPARADQPLLARGQRGQHVHGGRGHDAGCEHHLRRGHRSQRRNGRDQPFHDE